MTQLWFSIPVHLERLEGEQNAQNQQLHLLHGWSIAKSLIEKLVPSYAFVIFHLPTGVKNHHS